MAELDLERLKRRRSVTAPWELMHFATDEVDSIITALERNERLWRCGNGHIIEIDPGTPPYDMGTCPICEAQERAAEVADQGCEFCENAVDEPHAHWWACGPCWNESAAETSAVVGHLSDLLDRALERIPELERRVQDKNFDLAGVHEALRKETERAERVEAALREARDELEQGEVNSAEKALRAALADASEGRPGRV